MNAPSKRKISAKQILADIRSGMDASELKQRYNLSDKGLESVYRKLTAMGVVTNGEVPGGGKPDLDEPEPSRGEPLPTPWRCPACNAPHPVPVPECPHCGVIVEKFQARQASMEEASTLVPQDNATASRHWVMVACSIVVVALVGAVWLLLPDRKAKVKTSKTSRAAIEKRGVAQGTKRGFVPLGGKLLELQYSPEGFPLGLSTSQGFALHLFETPSPSQGFKKLPLESGTKRYYDEFSIAGKKYLVVTEASNPPTFHLDANRNGDLTDDAGPFTGEGPGLMPNHYTLQLPYDGEEELTPYRAWMFVSRMGGVRFYAKCHWKGLLTIGNNTYKVVLFDGNADGDYSNDPAVIDVNDDGNAAADEKLVPGKSMSIDGTLVKLVAISPSGRWIRLQY